MSSIQGVSKASRRTFKVGGEFINEEGINEAKYVILYFAFGRCAQKNKNKELPENCRLCL